MNVETPDQVLQHLLLDSQKFGCEYANSLSSHLPMALIALQKLGATSDELKAFYAHESAHLERTTQDKTQIDQDSWPQYLGLHAHNLPYRDFFLHELRQRGVRTVLESYLPQLMSGVSGGAFHPLIRLAYGIEVQSEWEIAEALASWCMAYQTLGPVSILHTPTPPRSLFASLEILAEQVKSHPVKVEGATVFAWFKCVSESQAFKSFFSQTHALDLSLPQISNAVLRLYLATNDSFTALHCVTATHALRIVQPYLKDSTLSRYLWQAVCATYVIVKCPAFEDLSFPSELPSWRQVFEAARIQDDDHVIKFVYSAFSESEHHRNELYRLAAAKKVRLFS
jgi:hypothetical protein